MPEGLELYLDVADIAGEGWLERLVGLLGERAVPADFAWVVEGPLRSLDGAFFDLGRDAAADREVLARIVAGAARIGAAAVVIHCIAPERDPAALTPQGRERAVACAEGVLAGYVELCQRHGLVPTVENVPPVARMREEAFVHTHIGMAPEDLVYFCDRLAGLRATCDTSHAQLYLNAAAADPGEQPPELRPVVERLARPGTPRTLADYVDMLGPRIYEAHVANAAGLLGEGLPYDEGDVDLDDAVARLLQVARFLVTEPIEPDPDRADRMRDVARRIAAVRERSARGGCA